MKIKLTIRIIFGSSQWRLHGNADARLAWRIGGIATGDANVRTLPWRIVTGDADVRPSDGVWRLAMRMKHGECARATGDADVQTLAWRMATGDADVRTLAWRIATGDADVRTLAWRMHMATGDSEV